MPAKTTVADDVAVLSQATSEPSISTLKKIFASLRRTNMVCSKFVAKYGWKVVRATDDLERWTVVEQVAVAALSVGDFELARECIQLLIVQFPKSFRVKRLLAMQHEAKGEFVEALELYDAILAEQPADTATLKRKACLCRAKGDRGSAVVALNGILSGSSGAMGDASTWMELAEIYLENSEHAEAAYCLEELVLLDPHNCHHHNRLADVYYTIGGVESLLRARKHYTMSLNYQSAESNYRALIGLIYTCQALASSASSSSSTSSSSSSSSSGSSSTIASSSCGDAADVKSGADEGSVTVALLEWALAELRRCDAAGGKSSSDSVAAILLSLSKPSSGN